MGSSEYTVAKVGVPLRAFLEGIIRNIGLQLKVDIADAEEPNPYFERPSLIVHFSGPDTDLLLANRAEALLAMEQLALEMLRVPSERHDEICFDAADYRMLRQEELRLSALAAAEKVKKTRVPFRFGPMTSRERRIVHLALRDDKEVRSESTGFGPGRQVTVYPANLPPASQLPPRHAGRRRR